MKVASSIACVLVALVPTVRALGVRPGQIKNFVTFGDSYTDVVLVSNGGTPWPQYVADYGHFTLFPFARAGATCSNNITFRPFPPVFESQLPTYFAEVANGTVRARADETVYTLWIGTNDLGVNSLITGDSALPPPAKASVVDTTTCAINWAKTLYNSGARNFIFQNMVPLDHTVLYSAVSHPNHYWTAPRNTTAWNIAMREMVAAGNALSKLMLQNLAPTLPGAHVALFDTHTMFSDIITSPSKFLNGTAPLNVTGSVVSCILQVNESTSDGGDCTIAQGTDKDSFVWFDELHPSEQSDRIMARAIADTMQGKGSQWTTWLS